MRHLEAKFPQVPGIFSYAPSRDIAKVLLPGCLVKAKLSRTVTESQSFNHSVSIREEVT